MAHGSAQIAVLKNVSQAIDLWLDTAREFNDPIPEAIIDYLATFPKTGVIMQGAGGISKPRCSHQNAGKSVGVRVIYYFHNEQMPLYLLTAFGKGEKANLSKAERNELAKLVRLLVHGWSAKYE
jgi:hypothetical protein